MAAAVAQKPRPGNINTGLATSTIQPGMVTARRIPRRPSFTESVSSAAPSNAPSNAPSVAHSAISTSTASDFGEEYTTEAIMQWTEDNVAEFLHGIKCGEYEELFRENHINGENILELDKDMLADMGIDKIGDRVRVGLAIKKLRNSAHVNHKNKQRQSKAAMNPYRMSIANLPSVPDIPPPLPARPASSHSNNRHSRLDLPLRAYPDKPTSPRHQSPYRSDPGLNSIPDDSTMGVDTPVNSSPSVTAYTPTSSRTPTSETANNNTAVAPPQKDQLTMELLAFQNQQVAFEHNVRHQNLSQETPRALPPTAPLSADGSHKPGGLSGGGLMTVLPEGAGVIRIITEGGVAKVIQVKHCKTIGEAVQRILKKFFIPEHFYPNYTFWVLMNLDRLYHNCRRLGDTELWDIMMDGTRPERNRIIMRRVSAGEPTESELHCSAALMVSEENLGRKLIDGSMDSKNISKITQLLGPGWEQKVDTEEPSFSSTFEQDHTRMIQDLERIYPIEPPRFNRKSGVMQFGGLRPVSEYITQDITAFFPDHDAEKIDKTARMSMRRSARLSRLNNRLSVASTFSLTSGVSGSGLEDAPPVPTIADSWLHGGDVRASFHPEAAPTPPRTSEEMDAEFNRRTASRAPRIPTIYGTQSFAASVFSPFGGTEDGFPRASSGSDTNRENYTETDDNETPIRASFVDMSDYTTETEAERTDTERTFANGRQSYTDGDNDATDADSPGQWVTTPRRSAIRGDNPYATSSSTLAGDINEIPRSQNSYGLDLESGAVAPNPRRLTLVRSRRSNDDGQDADDEADVIGHGDEDDEEMAAAVKENPENIRNALMADGEGEDAELENFLAGESWDESMWLKGALIGKGSFGCVYLALHTITGELMAVKQVESTDEDMDAADGHKRTVANALRREISFLRDLSHPNIVSYLGCGNSLNHMNIFLEYVPGGSVQMMLKSYGALPEPLIKSFVRQILQGLDFLHGLNIIHRDIKGGNILVDDKGNVKISDFGISKKMETTDLLAGVAESRRRPSMQGSVFWMAPEVVKQTSYTCKADIWSVGCLVVEMMTGSHPYPDCSQLQAIFKIGAGRIFPAIPEFASQDSRDFLFQCFEVAQDVRPGASELLLSPFQTDRDRDELAAELVALRLELAEQKMVRLEAEAEAKRIRDAEEAEAQALLEAAHVTREARASIMEARASAELTRTGTRMSAELTRPGISTASLETAGPSAPVAELMGPEVMELQAIAHEPIEDDGQQFVEQHVDNRAVRLERLGAAQQTDFGIEGEPGPANGRPPPEMV